jgi:hypothetical protein
VIRAATAKPQDSDRGAQHGEVLGFIPVTVNLCHTLCNFLTGLIGLVAVLRRSWDIAYAILGGGFYLAWGFLACSVASTSVITWASTHSGAGSMSLRD